MKHKESNVRAVSCFVVMFLFSSMINSIASASAIQRPLFAEQSCINQTIQNPSAVNRSFDILQMIRQVNASLLSTYIQKIQDFGPHPTGSKACEALGKYLYETLNSFHLSVRYDSWRYKLRSGNNIEATLQGTTKGDSIVIVSAHYDSVRVSPGADDDGSGVAVVLAVADIMSNYCFNSTVRFVLFSGEEQGLLGSHEYVQHAYRTGERIIADLQLDGVGYAVTSEDSSKIKHHSNNQSAWMVDISSAIASHYYDDIDLEVVRLPHVTFSDHESFVKYDYDASYFFEYFLTPYYHTSEDILEHMNITYLAKVCKLTVGTLASMAELHTRLSNHDIAITIKGQALTYPCQFYVRIENKKPRVDTVNVTINIALKNLRTGQYILMMKNNHNLTCNWTFTKEIRTFWEFKTMGRRYSPQIISLEVTVRGIKDDVTLYVTQRSIGITIGWSIFLFPKC
jgi:aminopeptidase YwaD